MSALGIGVIGSGFMGRTHIDAAEKIDQARPIAITGGSRASAVAGDYGIDCEADLDSLLSRDDIDAVVIATPHWLHCEQALAAAEAGKHVLVEKPMATSLDDCDRMSRLCEEKGLTLSLGYHQRFRESNYRTCDLIRGGAIGQVRCIQMSALFDITAMRSDSGFGGTWSWWTDPKSIAHLINSAPHNIDLCRWWIGGELVSAAAHSGTFREENPNENTTMALLQFDTGAMATYWSSSVLPSPGFDGESFRFRIMGDDGVIDLDPYGHLRLGREGSTEVVFEQPAVGHDDSNSAFAMNRMQAYCDQMAAFVCSIQGGETERDGEGDCGDGKAGVAAVLAMLESAKTGRMITLDSR